MRNANAAPQVGMADQCIYNFEGEAMHTQRGSPTMCAIFTRFIVCMKLADRYADLMPGDKQTVVCQKL